MKTNAFLPVLGFLALLLAGLSACDEGTPVDPNEGRPVRATLTAGDLTAGDTLRATPGQTVEVAVLLIDGQEEPVEGWPVDWSVGGGMLDGADAETGADGKARAQWTLPDTAGTYTLDVVAEGVRNGATGAPISPNNSPDLYATVPAGDSNTEP